MTNYYETLGVEKNASEDDIKQAYKKLAKIHHPDKGGNKSKFQEIQEAYDTLSDENKRREYDNPMSNIFGSGMNVFPFNINEMFGMQMNRNMKKADQHYECFITLDDVYKGVKKSFNIKRNFICTSCKKNCNKCNGLGMVSKRIQMGPMLNIINQPCDNCSGTGKTRNDIKCDVCNSTGKIEESKLIELVIPKGVENGKTYLYEGWGQESNNINERPGNLIIIIRVQDHPIFKRNGLNLKTVLKLTFKESIIGKKISIPYFSDSIEIDAKFFGIINPLKEYTIPYKGLEDEKGNKGNILITFVINYGDDNKRFTNEEIKLIDDIFTKVDIK